MLDPLVRWLLSDTPRLSLEASIVGLGERLVAEGVPVERLWCGTMEVNPLSAGQAFTWRPGRELERISMGFAQRASIRENDFERHVEGPIPTATRTGFSHCRLTGLPRGSWGLASAFWDEPFTEFVVICTPRSFFGSATIFTFATLAPLGFTEAHIERLRELRDPLGVVFDLRAQETLTKTLARTYLGAGVGQRVLAGQIRRGDGVTVTAALWFSDLRGFTTLSDTLPRDELLSILDDAFEAQVAAVEEHGGEVLKFMGDGMLAIFPATGDRGSERVCGDALAAATAFDARLKIVNAARVERGALAIAYGLALHYGDVMYGNIGAPARLDFTVIGPAVNLAARLEGVAAKVGHNLVLSSEFATRCGAEVVSASKHLLKGLSEPHEVFVLKESPN